MFRTVTVVYFVFSQFYVLVDSSCWSESPAVSPGEPPATTCNYHGWIFDGLSLTAPAPYCEQCRCYGGLLSCCGYGWKAGSVSVDGCIQKIDNSTCDLLFVDADDETQPCNSVSIIQAEASNYILK